MIESGTRTRTALFAAFASLGVTAAFVPAILPSAERAIGSDLSAAVPALFGGLLVGVLASGPLLMRRPPRTALMLGSVLQAAAIVAVALADAPAVFIAAAALAGFGFGLVEASGSVSAKSAVVGSATGLLSALLGTVAVCAAATPLLVAAASGTRPLLVVLAAVPLLAAAMLAGPVPAAPRADAPARRDVRGLRFLLPFAVALPLYVGVETVLSGWSAAIPERILEIDPGTAALGTSAFWALMALGRFGAATLRRLSVPPLVILASATSGAAVLIATAGMLVGPAPAGALLALGAAVVLLSPSYGLILGIALDRLDPARSAAVTGALVACGAVGGTFVPALILLIGRDPASSTTFLVSAGLCALVPVLVLISARLPARRPDADRVT
ncbi:fucose permease [Microbacterium resistens]|uniref:Fucose permease n=1 Tax=Microbacterium resistens TaxID=156977 RepID=A0ABU1S9C0_9MICO|nr:MFS transporter [Microbacterium resistens]MDR6866184.1 fucose permease [Microbacterium resistens]